jgi:hypothetical protein
LVDCRGQRIVDGLRPQGQMVDEPTRHATHSYPWHRFASSTKPSKTWLQVPRGKRAVYGGAPVDVCGEHEAKRPGQGHNLCSDAGHPVAHGVILDTTGSLPRPAMLERIRMTSGTLIIGILLLALGQFLTLVHLQPVCEYWYGIVWTGFILTAESLIHKRTGVSLLFSRPTELAFMFLASAAAWWLFELANLWLLGSWTYSPSPDVPHWVQMLRSTYFFATLLPATWDASMLALLLWPRAPQATRQRHAWAVMAGATGLALLGLALLFRGLSLPLGLLGAGLLLDASNWLRSRPSLLANVAAGSWSLVLCIGLGNMGAGLAGEMWNYPAQPRWTYDAPYAGRWHVFAMPVFGYFGYAALALVLFAAYHAVRPRFAPPVTMPDTHPLSRAGLIS